MTPLEAKKLYNDSVKTNLDGVYMKAVYDRIKQLIVKDKRKDYDWDYLINDIEVIADGKKLSCVKYKDEIKEELVKQGYRFKHFPDRCVIY